MQQARDRGDSRRQKELQQHAEQERFKLAKAQETLATADRLAAADGRVSADDIVQHFRDTLAEHLDKQQGAQVTDKSIFRCASPTKCFMYSHALLRVLQVGPRTAGALHVGTGSRASLHVGSSCGVIASAP